MRVVCRCDIVVRLFRAPDQPLNRISRVINHKNHNRQVLRDHGANLLNRERHAAVACEQHRTTGFVRLQFRARDFDAESCSGREADAAVVDLRDEARVRREFDVAQAEVGGAGFADDQVVGLQEGFDGGPEEGLGELGCVLVEGGSGGGELGLGDGVLG